MPDERGSEKLWQRLFETEAPKGEHLAELLSLAPSEFTVQRWWKYGQPAIDAIRAVFDVSPNVSPGVLGSLINLHGRELQVSLEVFPYGIVAPDVLRVNVLLERNVQR